MPHFSKHLPEVQIYGDMSRHDTQRIRSLLKLSIEGYRTLRILVSRKLAPLMSVAGEEFGSCEMYVYYNPFSLLTETILYAQSMHSFGIVKLNMEIQPSGMSCIMSSCTAEFCAIMTFQYPDDNRACLERTGRE